MAVVDQLQIAAALPAYTIGDELGAGGFGLVLAGRHRELDRPVAIKVLAAGTEWTDADLFRAEARLLSRLDHPHIVRVYDYVSRGDLRLLIMELLPGGTLAELELPPPAACAVGLAVAAGLSAAHDSGVLHRDIKPANLLFTAGGQPKITDFGIAKIFDRTAEATDRMVGTPSYMAPEQLRGESLGPATDLYALGVVLYEQLAGRLPVDEALPMQERLRQHLEVMPPAPPGAPGPIAAVILRALAKDPASRYASARDLGRALAEAAAEVYGPDWLAASAIQLAVDLRFTDPGEARTDETTNAFAPGVDRFRRAAPPRSVSQLGGLPPADGAYPLAADDITRSPEGRGDPAASSARRADPAPASPAVTGGPSPIHAAPAGAGAPDQARARAGQTSGRSGWARVPLVACLVVAVIAVGVAHWLIWPRSDPRRPAAVRDQPVATTPGRLPSGAVPSPSGSPGKPEPPQIDDLVVAPDGTIYLASKIGKRVLRIDRSGRMEPVAGAGEAGSARDGIPATQARLRGALSITRDAAGNLYILDSGSQNIRKVNTAGIISTVAGRGADANSPAAEVRISSSSGSLTIDEAGNLYFVDISSVVRLDPAGTVTTIAGNGDSGSPGEGVRATETPLGLIGDLVVRDGSLYIADSQSSQVLRVGPDGIIRTVAGTGVEGFSGDTLRAVESQLELSTDSGIAFDAEGNLYIGDDGNARVRRVDTSGIITTVGGNGVRTSFREGRPAVDTPLFSARFVAVDAAGSVYVAGLTDICRIDPGGAIHQLTKG